MKCVVPGANIKILAKAIQSLAKIGDEMYVEPQDNGLSFRTVNMAKSAYASFMFYDKYFSFYTFGDLEQEDALKCKIAMRSAMAVFKSAHMLDKQLETCHIELETKSCRLVFNLKYKNGITKTHFLPILDCQVLQAVFSKQDSPNKLSALHKVLTGVMQNFQPNLIEITLEVTPQRLLLRNYIDDTSDLSKVTRTQLALGVGEFEQYKIRTDTSITFCVKEFKAVLNFAEAVSSPISIHFEKGGKPVIFVIESQTFEANIVMSTLNSETDSQSEISSVRALERTLVKKSAANKRAAKKTTQPVNRRTKKISGKFERMTNTNTSKPMAVTNLDQSRNSDSIHQEEPMAVDSNDNGLVVTNADNILGDNNINYPDKNSETSSIGKPSYSKKQNIFSSNASTVSVSKATVNSVFSTITNKSNTNPPVLPVNEDIVPNSPPKHPTNTARVIFKKCFQTTFDPRMLPGHDVVLVEDTDDSE
ncbi:cell cycle checkpoint control protein RAD9A [Athalia rosae]|uniref:cell cycle checkpoint control protein RAD9A n=1 Tax=Athalia rosae TaxID=37344 RepID=UPI00203440A2|nr:cell cycle checkpoint control protein RAD9A [Athalia rosae]